MCIGSLKQGRSYGDGLGGVRKILEISGDGHGAIVNYLIVAARSGSRRAGSESRVSALTFAQWARVEVV